MTDDDTRDALHRSLCALTVDAGEDELRVLLDLAHRILVVGRREYGELSIRAVAEGRDLRREAREELLDWAVYRSIRHCYEGQVEAGPLDLGLRQALVGG